MNDKKYLSTGNNEHPTPKKLFDEIDKMFGFEVDLSASLENTKCEKFFSIEDDSLIQDWGRFNSCWCNPPYSKDLQPLFIQKAYETNKKNKNTIALLIPLRGDTKVWHNYIWGKADIYVFNGRPKFYGDKSPTYASALVVYSNKEKYNVYSCSKEFTNIEKLY